jgi:Zn-dependent peptidase ImmA (M78 family)
MSIKRAILKAKTVLDQYKIEFFPIDIEKIASNEKINIIKTSLPEKVSGILEPADNKIYINENDNEKRQRFTIAHELGHFFLNHCDGIHVDNFKRAYRDTKSTEGLYIIEIEANNFAAELLMPSEEVNKKIESFSDDTNLSIDQILDDLSTYFNVSQEAMRNKLKNLGYVIDVEQF